MFAAAFSDEAYHGAIELCSRFPLLVIINSPMSPRLSEKNAVTACNDCK